MAKDKNFIILKCEECKCENYITSKKSKTKTKKQDYMKKSSNPQQFYRVYLLKWVNSIFFIFNS